MNTVNSSEKPALSNSRLNAHFRQQFHSISWDKMTLIGDLNPQRINVFKSFIAHNPQVTVFDVKTDLVKAKLYDGLFYLEYDAIKAKAFGRRNVRIEFNPNNCDEDAREFLLTHIVSCMTHIGFSRLDLAIDIKKDLKTFYAATENPTKQTVFYGRDGKPETKYFGTRESERYIRLYNKKQERKDNANQELEFENLWRLEFELKRDRIDNWKTVADDLILKEPDWKSIEDSRTKAFVYMLLNEPAEWGELTRFTRSKYRKIIREMEGEDLTGSIQKIIQINTEFLQQDLEKWTGNKLI